MIAVVTGPENSGSRLCARITAQVLQVCNFGFDWPGYGWAPNNISARHKVLHRSTPYGNNEILNIDDISAYDELGPIDDIRFIFTTRDGSISRSKYEKYTDDTWQKALKANISIIDKVRSRNLPYMFWSYESLLLYGETYLFELYQFLGVEGRPSEFVPPLLDANRKYLK